MTLRYYLLLCSLCILSFGISCSKRDSQPSPVEQTDARTISSLVGRWGYELNTLTDLPEDATAVLPKGVRSVLGVVLQFRPDGSFRMTIYQQIDLQDKHYQREAACEGKYQLKGDRILMDVEQQSRALKAIPELELEASVVEFASGRAVLRWTKEPEQLVFIREESTTPLAEGSASDSESLLVKPIFKRLR